MAASPSSAIEKKPATAVVGQRLPDATPLAIFSVDVEDWFHILDLPSTPDLASWEQLPSCVEKNFSRLLAIFAEKNVAVTCFFLGWVGERFPHLVKAAANAGHEIASHGFSHRLVSGMAAHEFRKDAERARIVLEDISGVAVRGFRSPGFSVTKRSPWFFEELAKAGYYYDSSIFPARRAHGGMPDASRVPFRVQRDGWEILEFPIAVANVAMQRLCFSGGGYLRLLPYWMIRQMAWRELRSGVPVVFYIHPREIDPNHPRLPMNTIRHFKSYVNLGQTEDKIRRILDEFPVTTFQKACTLYTPQLTVAHAA